MKTQKSNFENKSIASAGFNNVLSYSAAFALFIFLPVIIAAVLGSDAINLKQQREFEVVRKQLETRLDQFAAEVDTDTYLRKVARGAWWFAQNRNYDSDKLSKFIEKIKKLSGVELDIYLFNEKGRLETPREILVKSRFIAKKLWNLVKADPIKQSRIFENIRKPLKSFLGHEFKVAQLLDKKDGLLPIIVRHQSGRIYWNEAGPDSKAGIIVIFWQKPNLDKRIKETLKRNSNFFERGALFKNVNEFYRLSGEKLRKDVMKPVYTRLTLLNNPHEIADDFVWMGRKIEENWIIAGESFSPDKYKRWLQMLMYFLAFLVLLSLLLTYKAGKSRNLRVSIRLKLVVLFFTAVLVPVMGFIFLGYQYLADREETMVAEVAGRNRTELFSLDESFRNIGKAYEKEWKELIPLFASEDEELISRELEEKLRTNELVTVELRDIEADIKYTKVNELFFEGMKEVSEAFSRFCIDTALGTNLAESVDPIVSMIVKAPEGGMFFLFDRPGEIHPLEFGPAPLLIFWQIIENKFSQKRYLFILQSATVLLKKLVKKRMLKTYRQRKQQPDITVARHNTSGRWLPAKLQENLQLKKFAQRLKFSNKPQDSHIKINGKTWFVTGLKGKYASDYCFFSFYPREFIDDDLNFIRKLIVASILIFLLVALLTGNILSLTFLEPISRLSQGVEAIKKRQSEFRIETGQRDEFGDLAVNFNHMIEDLKEMELAGDVQESLLPGTFPDIPGYQLQYVNRMASDVGGDYFDLYWLDENRLCLLIGDVTGHGVSSALVMAMAKATVYQGLKEKKPLVELFSDLNSAVNTYFKIPPARKMITFFAAILNIDDGAIEYANAGHNFPVIIRKNKEIEFLSAVHLPIGASKKLRGLKTHQTRLNSGDTLVFYTDGIIEVKNNFSEMMGYENFKAVLFENSESSADKILAKLMAAYDSYLAGSDPDDDVTIIVLKKD
ncbi:MAG: SpoIIE family protein phosphatase [Candidatus Rifleibacteriota bacterium]